MWDLTGGYIGTFGQADVWNIRNPATYRRPNVPYDVLIDPLSVPGPDGTIETEMVDPKDKTTMIEVLAEMKAEQKNAMVDGIDLWSNKESANLSSDCQIEEEIRTRIYSAGNGKRLRHERMKMSSRSWLGSSYFQTLRCHDLDEGPAKSAVLAEQANKEVMSHVPRSSQE